MSSNSNDNTELTMAVVGCFGIIILLVVGIAWGIIVNAFGLTVLWNWFLVPNGSPELGIPLAIGISLIFSLLTKDYRFDPNEEKKHGIATNLGILFGIPIIRIGLVLFIGWIAAQFI